MKLGLLLSILIICASLSIPLVFILRAYFLSKKPPTPNELFLLDLQKNLEQREIDLLLRSDQVTDTLQSLEERREALDREKKLLAHRKKQLDEKERYLSDGAYQIFLDYVIDSTLTREYLLMTPAFQKLIDPDYSEKRYSRSLRDMEASISIEAPFDVTAIVRDTTGRYHTTLHRCDCDFYQRFHHPCTHMIRLALEVGGAMCFAPSDESPDQIKHAKYSPFGNKIWIPIKRDNSNE